MVVKFGGDGEPPGFRGLLALQSSLEGTQATVQSFADRLPAALDALDPASVELLLKSSPTFRHSLQR